MVYGHDSVCIFPSCILMFHHSRHLSVVYLIDGASHHAHEIMDSYCKSFGIGHRVMSHDWHMFHIELWELVQLCISC